jgi:hypothetical protein
MFALLVWKSVQVAGGHALKRMAMCRDLRKSGMTSLVYVNTPASTIT